MKWIVAFALVVPLVISIGCCFVCAWLDCKLNESKKAEK
jgi:hypothetical protein